MFWAIAGLYSFDESTFHSFSRVSLTILNSNGCFSVFIVCFAMTSNKCLKSMYMLMGTLHSVTCAMVFLRDSPKVYVIDKFVGIFSHCKRIFLLEVFGGTIIE